MSEISRKTRCITLKKEVVTVEDCASEETPVPSNIFPMEHKQIPPLLKDDVENNDDVEKLLLLSFKNDHNCGTKHEQTTSCKRRK